MDIVFQIIALVLLIAILYKVVGIERGIDFENEIMQDTRELLTRIDEKIEYIEYLQKALDHHNIVYESEDFWVYDNVIRPRRAEELAGFH